MRPTTERITAGVARNGTEDDMAELFVTGSLAVFLVASLYGAYRIYATRGTGRSAYREHGRRSSSGPQPAGLAGLTQGLSYYETL